MACARRINIPMDIAIILHTLCWLPADCHAACAVAALPLPAHVSEEYCGLVSGPSGDHTGTVPEGND